MLSIQIDKGFVKNRLIMYEYVNGSAFLDICVLNITTWSSSDKVLITNTFDGWYLFVYDNINLLTQLRNC